MPPWMRASRLPHDEGLHAGDHKGQHAGDVEDRDFGVENVGDQEGDTQVDQIAATFHSNEVKDAGVGVSSS